MSDAGILGESPAVRVSGGGGQHTQMRELLHAAREEASSVTVEEVGSTGLLTLEPLAMATLDGETAYFSRCSVSQLVSVVGELEDGTLPTDDAMAVVEHESGTTALPVPEDTPFDVGERTVLSACGWVSPYSLADRRAIGDYACSDTSVGDETIASLREANLRGRGRCDGATDEPIAEHWATARDTEGDPAIVVNANEADPNAEMDRLLLESDPYAVLDAALAAAKAVDATNVVVYTGKGDALARDRASAAASGLADEFDGLPPIEVLAGPDEYMAGEMTMAIEALEGNHRIEARLRPPYPSEQGLYGRPTLVHTPRTLVQAGAILRSDSTTDASSDPGTRLFTVAGDVDGPATVELSTDDDLATAREAVEFDGHLKAACVGGVFGGLSRTLDVPARANALTAAGLGTNGVVELFDEEQCMVSFAGNRAKFARDENCGRCVPCREGSAQLVDVLRDIYDGTYQAGKLRELLRVMGETSICQFGETAPRPVLTAMNEFEPEFEAHANGRCPTGTCGEEKVTQT